MENRVYIVHEAEPGNIFTYLEEHIDKTGYLSGKIHRVAVGHSILGRSLHVVTCQRETRIGKVTSLTTSTTTIDDWNNHTPCGATQHSKKVHKVSTLVEQNTGETKVQIEDITSDWKAGTPGTKVVTHRHTNTYNHEGKLVDESDHNNEELLYYGT